MPAPPPASQSRPPKPSRRAAPASARVLALPPPEAQRATLAAALGVAPEAVAESTLDRLTTLLDRLAKWTRRINLIGPTTLPDAWSRHVLDSARLLPLIPTGTRRLADLGSGAGFPGLVLAILGVSDVHLVESDQRKAAFLREAARASATPVTVHACRIEALAPLSADVVTARALAPLPDLLPLVSRHLAPEGLALLPKGRTVDSELTACGEQWIMRVERCPEAVAPGGQPPKAPAAADRPLTGATPVHAPPSDPADRDDRDDRDGAGGCVLVLREIRHRAPFPS